MANSYKNIVITPNIGNTAEPRIQFSGGNTTANTDINLYVYPTSNGTVSFEGSAGQLFSITNDLSNLIFSVADVSGIPSLEVYANGLVSIAPLGGNVVIGSTSELVISSGAGIYANGSLGTAGHTLHSDGSSVYWATDDQGVTSVTAGTGLSGGTITGTGTISMPNVGPGSGSYSGGISAVTLDAQGRVTAITGSAGYVTSSGVTSVAAGTGLSGGTITGTGTLSVNASYIATIAWPINGATTDANTAGQGIWRMNVGAGSQPSGTEYGTLLSFDNVSDTGFQLASDYTGSNFYWRSGNSPVYGGSGSFSAWRRLLHDGNFNSYSPTLTGTGASGTWGISVTGTAYGKGEAALNVNNATSAGGLLVHAGRNNEANKIVRTDSNGYLQAGWINTPSGDNGTTAITKVYASSDDYIRTYTPANFRTVLDVPTRTGGGASGTWSINVTGTAYGKTEGNLNVNNATTALTANNATNLGGTAASAYDKFPAGTVMLFVQTAAPTGWTKSTAHDNKALRIVSGTVASGGSVAFTTAFASQSVSGTIANTVAAGTIANTVAGGDVGNHTLTTSQIPAHTHYIAAATTSSTTTVANTTAQVNRSRDISTNSPNYILTATTTAATVGLTSSTGGGAAHNHTFTGTTHGHTFTGTTHGHTFTGTAINLAVSYVDAIIATKN